MKRLFSVSLIVPLIFLVGCGTGTESGPPAGWEQAEGRWWSPDVDTTRAFRDLSTLEAMEAVAEEGSEEANYVERRVRAELRPLFRNNPQVIDSLFDAYVVSLIADAGEGDVEEQVQQFKNEGYQALRKHYREPRPALQLGEDVPLTYPDSLRQQDVGGRVRMQVYLDAEGAPQAIKLIESVHPVLDQKAMTAASQMRWEPAGVRAGGEWRYIPAWTRYSINFRTN